MAMTDPAAMPDDETAEAAPDAEQAEGGDASQGFVVELSCLPDGTFNVSGPEPLQAEADEEQGEDAGQNCQSIGEALKAILSIYKEASSGTSEDDQMAAGFNGVRGQG